MIIMPHAPRVIGLLLGSLHWDAQNQGGMIIMPRVIGSLLGLPHWDASVLTGSLCRSTDLTAWRDSLMMREEE